MKREEEGTPGRGNSSSKGRCGWSFQSDQECWWLGWQVSYPKTVRDSARSHTFALRLLGSSLCWQKPPSRLLGCLQSGSGTHTHQVHKSTQDRTLLM